MNIILTLQAAKKRDLALASKQLTHFDETFQQGLLQGLRLDTKHLWSLARRVSKSQKVASLEEASYSTIALVKRTWNTYIIIEIYTCNMYITWPIKRGFGFEIFRNHSGFPNRTPLWRQTLLMGAESDSSVSFAASDSWSKAAKIETLWTTNVLVCWTFICINTPTRQEMLVPN